MSIEGNWTVVRSVISATDTGASAMSSLPTLVQRLIDEGMWQEFATPDHGVVRHEKFTEFVKAAPTRGLGGRISQLVALCGGEETELGKRVQRLAREEIEPAAEPGGDRRSEEFQGSTTTLKGERGADYAVARLKRDAATDPRAAELVERVVSGEMSAYAADRLTGKRPPRIELRSPRAVAERLRQHFTPEQLAELRNLLDQEDGS